MANTLKVSELEVGRIYVEVLSQLRVRVNHIFANGTRASVTYFSPSTGRFLVVDVGDHRLRPVDTSWNSDEG